MTFMEPAKLISEAINKCKEIGTGRLLFWLLLLLTAWFFIARSPGDASLSYVVPGSGI